MAISFENIKNKLENPVLTREELIEIDKVEIYVDSVLIKEYKGDEVCLPLDKVDFTHSSNGSRDYNKASIRAKLQFKRLIERYAEAGWASEVRMNVGDDGPNRPGQDYWVLKGGKNKYGE